MNSLEISTNCTTRFLLPTVFPNTTYDELIANGFIKAYIGMLDDDTYDDSLMLLFHKDADDEVLSELFGDMDVDVLDDEEHEELQMVVVNDWKDYMENDDYPNFLSGKWSEFSPNHKENILSFWGETNVSILYMVLYKDPKFNTIVRDFTSTLFAGIQNDDVKEAEYWPKPDVIEDELYFTGDQ
jgi:hypothetical protein